MKLRVFSILTVLLTTLLANSPAAAADGYTFQTIAVPGAIDTYPKALNNVGQIAGIYANGYYFAFPNVYALQWRGFVFSSGAYTSIDYPGATWTKAWTITDTGQVIGSYQLAGEQIEHLFQYDMVTGQYTAIPFSLSGNPIQVTIYGINATGAVIGQMSSNPAPSYQWFNPNNAFYPNSGFYYENGKTTVLAAGANPLIPQAINAAGELIVLSSANEAVYQTYLNGALTPVADGLVPNGLGPNGQIVGYFNNRSNDGLIHGAIYDDGAITFVDVPDAATIITSPSTFPVAMTGTGQLIGTVNHQDGSTTGFLANPPAPVAGEKARIFIDTPNIGASTNGSIIVAGWAIDNVSSISTVSIRVDGRFMGVASYGAARTDVCAAYPGQSGCPNVGWSFSLDTTKIADGIHSLEAIITSNTGIHAVAARSLTVANAKASRPNPIQMNVDSPGGPNAKLAGQITVYGWAFDAKFPIVSVQVTIDPSLSSFYYSSYYATTGLPRPDVCAAFSNASNCMNSGWMLPVPYDTSTLSNGKHTLAVLVSAANGDSQTFTTAFTVSNDGPLRAWIDQPGSTSGALSGSAVISGWAEDDNLKVNSFLSLVIDGGASSYIYPPTYFGGYRSDVCKVYPKSPDCPNVGWSALLDTTQLTNGPHTVAVQAYSVYDVSTYRQDTAQSAPVVFTVNNQNSTASTHLGIDTPSAQGQIFFGAASFSGWAVDDNTTIRQIAISIDGTTAGNAYTYNSRPDICDIYPNRPNCASSGWTYYLNTLQLSNGVHTITATAFSLVSQATVSAAFTVANNNADSTKVFIDVPSAGGAALSGQATVAGWAINNVFPIANVQILVDGSPFGYAQTGISRPDVCKVYPTAPNCSNLGWISTMDTTLLTNGPHLLEVVENAYSFYTGASQSAAASRLFTVSNSTANNPVSAFIDVPNAKTPPLSGVVSFSGWALDTTTTIASVSISIDGAPSGVASYGGGRPDVCAAYPTAGGCPAANLGWVFAVDTTALANGSHTLTITATSADGGRVLTTAPFTVAN